MRVDRPGAVDGRPVNERSVTNVGVSRPLGPGTERSLTPLAPAEGCSLTGLELWWFDALGAERLTWTFDDGRREQAVRLPGEFVPGLPAPPWFATGVRTPAPSRRDVAPARMDSGV